MLNTQELPVIGTLYFQVIKFMSAFQLQDYMLLEAKTIDDLLSMNPCEKDFVYISDHGLSRNLNDVISSFERLNCLNCTFILWFYHNHINVLPMPKKWILTGEHFRKKPKVIEHIQRWEIQSNLQNYVPMTFAAGIFPENIGKYKRNEFLHASFVGAPYQIDWCQKLTALNNNISIRYTPPFISEADRCMMYLSSVVSLGFHSENNSLNSVLVERVFDGLALGNIVISDNPVCEEFTDGIVKHVSSLEEVSYHVEFAWNNLEDRKARQKRGLLWSKENGTYLNVSKKFIEKSKELWGS